MAEQTGIQWCDSTQNLQMGCEGCELVKGKEINHCYAKSLTDRYAGRKGWPEAFEKPKIFMERLPKMLSWSDLTGTQRPEKPWLNNLPRIIFLNDMGDTFSSGMPKNWFAEALPKIAESPHQYLVLTKWPKRFAEFSREYKLPDNVWAGSSPTENKTKFRINQIKEVDAKIKFLSIEPLWEKFTDVDLKGISWVIIGGESGLHPTPCNIGWIKDLIFECKKLDIPVFVKQMGTHIAKLAGYKDNHGGDWNEWPERFNLRIREFPIFDQWKSTLIPHRSK